MPPDRYNVRSQRFPRISDRIVYFAQRDSDGAVKIGTTGSPQGRITQLAYDYRCHVRLLGWLPGYLELEARIHEMFAADVIVGEREMFRPSPELLAFAAKPSIKAVPFGPARSHRYIVKPDRRAASRRRSASPHRS